MKEQKKESITIEADPTMAVITISMLRNFMPAIVKILRDKFKEIPEPVYLDESLEERMLEVLNEIYEKSIALTPVRQKAAEIMEMIEMTGGQFPDEDTIN